MAARAIEGSFMIDSNVPPVNEEDEDETSQARKRNTKLSSEQRRAIYEALLSRSVHGKLKQNSTKEVSTLFSVPMYSVQRVWKRARESHDAGTVDVFNRLGNCGRRKIPIDLTRMTAIPLPQRTSLRSLAHGLGVNCTKLYRVLKHGDFRRHSNAIKPYLKEEHKRARLQFCISMLEQNSLSHELMFGTMHNRVHIDEKWFYMTKSSETYYLLNSEEDPLRTCQSKNFIGKVMFLVAMARPRFDDEGNEVFSGKMGVFPFAHYQPAQRRSRNRDAGTLELKPITSVKRETVKEFLITKVLPKIQEVWPRDDLGKIIFIQQDNARTHINPNDVDFQNAASQTGFDIRLVCQPANSPDLNILDLGFFRAIQSLQQKMHVKCIEDLIQSVQKSFDEYPATKVDHIFLSLQLCMREILKVGGSNKYKIPHVNKAALAKEGRLPTQITCDLTIVQNVMNSTRTLEIGLE